jgi:hypothetical protein
VAAVAVDTAAAVVVAVAVDTAAAVADYKLIFCLIPAASRGRAIFLVIVISSALLILPPLSPSIDFLSSLA